MFQKLEVLSRSRHSHLRLSPQRGFAYAASHWLVPLVHHEVPMIAREVPVVFGGGEGAMPMALMGAGPGQNLHITDKGQWVGRYIPAHIRRYPFILGELQATPQSEQAIAAGEPANGVRHVVQFDADAPHLAGSDGVQLVTEAGATPALEKIMDVLRVLQQDFERTRALVKQLDALSLLSVQRIQVQPKGTAQPVEIKGLRLVDSKAFAALEGNALKALRDTGALALVHAHFFSLTNLRDGLIGMGPPTVAKPDAAKPVLKAGMLPADTDLNFDDIDWSKFSRGT